MWETTLLLMATKTVYHRKNIYFLKPNCYQFLQKGALKAAFGWFPVDEIIHGYNFVKTK